MMIIINEHNREKIEKIREILSSQNVEYKEYSNSYKAVCEEEVLTTLGNLSCEMDAPESLSFNSEEIEELADELYSSEEVYQSFSQIAEISNLIVGRKIHNKTNK